MSTSGQYRDDVLPGPALRRGKEHPNKVFLMSRFDASGRRTPDQIHKVTWGEADRIIRDFAKGLWEMGFKAFDRLAVFSPNRPHWIYACMSAILSRGVHVPIYPTSKEEDVWWILYDSGARFVVAGGMDHAQKVLAVKDRVETVEKVILMDPLPAEHDSFIMGFAEVVELGRKSGITDEDLDRRVQEIDPEDLAAIIYTSGTTGRPKGVMLSHRNFVAQRPLEKEFDYSDNEIFLAHLPMCHSYGFSADFLNAGNIGATLFVADSLDAAEMRRNLLDVRPTVMNSVPRLWEKLYIQIGKTIKEQPPRRQKLVNWALKVGEEHFRLKTEKKPAPFTLELQAKVAGRIIQKVKKKAGTDRLKYSSTGGGPIDPKLIYFFGGLGINIYQGFGLTETAPIITANTPRHNKIGTVGRPLPNVEIKIAEDGEILVRAPQVMKGYYNNPTATAEVLSPDGWFATGDIGELDSDGYLKITDRKKELLITSGGKNIAPQPIENEFNTDPYVETVCALGDNRKYIAALVVPEFDNVRTWLKEQTGEDIADRHKLIAHPKVKELMDQRIAEVNKRLAKYEQIKKYVLLPEPFSEQTGELTPSQKKKRRVIMQKYAKEIESLYPPEE